MFVAGIAFSYELQEAIAKQYGVLFVTPEEGYVGISIPRAWTKRQNAHDRVQHAPSTQLSK
jgi:hypothetical protein